MFLYFKSFFGQFSARVYFGTIIITWEFIVCLPASPAPATAAGSSRRHLQGRTDCSPRPPPTTLPTAAAATTTATAPQTQASARSPGSPPHRHSPRCQRDPQQVVLSVYLFFYIFFKINYFPISPQKTLFFSHSLFQFFFILFYCFTFCSTFLKFESFVA